MNGFMVRKSTPKRTINSIRRMGLSLSAYLITIAGVNISSVVVNPKSCIIFLEVKAAMSLAGESMSKVKLITYFFFIYKIHPEGGGHTIEP